MRVLISPYSCQILFLKNFSLPTMCDMCQILVLICISWTTNDVEHPRSFVYFLCKKAYLNDLPIFKNWIIFLLLSCQSLVCILDTGPLSDMWFANIFSHSGHFVLWSTKFFFLIFMKPNLYMYSSVTCAFGIVAKKLLPIQGHKDLLLCFLFLKFYSVSTYIQVYDSFWVDFCVCCEIGFQFYYFACRYPVVLAPFVEKSYIIFVKKEKTLF